MNKELSKIRDMFFAGKSAFEKKQLNTTLKKINLYLGKIVTEDLLKKQKKLAPILTEIFSLSFPGKLASELGTKLNKDIYFNFGSYLLKKSKSDKNISKKLLHEYLNIFRVNNFLTKIYDQKKWEKLIRNLILESNFKVSTLFEQRVRDYESKTLFKILHGQTENNYSYETVNEHINNYKK